MLWATLLSHSMGGEHFGGEVELVGAADEWMELGIRYRQSRPWIYLPVR